VLSKKWVKKRLAKILVLLPILQICMINQMVVIWTAYLIISEVKTMPGRATAKGYMDENSTLSRSTELSRLLGSCSPFHLFVAEKVSDCAMNAIWDIGITVENLRGGLGNSLSWKNNR